MSVVNAVEALHGAILDAWDHSDAVKYANHFADDGLVVGFDGSEMHGRSAIAEQLTAIFADHDVARYIRIVRSVRLLHEGVATLHAIVGMVPPGGDDVMPDRHAVQLLVATSSADGEWIARSFQNTPVRLDSDPDALEALTAELQAAAEF